MKIHHFGIKVIDINKSIKFYTEKLGFKIKTPKTTTEDKQYTYTNLDLNGAELELIQIHDKDEKIQRVDFISPPICPHIGLETNDFENDLEMLKKRGVKIFDGPYTIENDVKIFTILDPDGYRIDIGQLLK